MKGLKTLIKYSVMADKKWDSHSFNYKAVVEALDEHDKAIVKDLFYIGEGEFGGSSMLMNFVKRVIEMPHDEWHVFNEMVVFGTQILVYEEFRHGVALKQLNALLDGWDYVEEVDSRELVKYLMSGIEIWNNPYEALVSFFTGEIVNAILYQVVEDQVHNKDFKTVVANIKKDEIRHKMAWFEISKNLINEGEEHKQKYIEALKKMHTIHQAEVIGENYAKGAMIVQKYFTHKSIEKIYTEKFELLTKILGEDMPFTKFEIKEQYARSMVRIARIARGM